MLGGGGNPPEEGSAALPINLVSPPTTTYPTEDPQLPNWGGGPEVTTGLEPVFASNPEPNHLWWLMSHHNILWWTSPGRHRRGRILLVLVPLRRHPAPARWLTSRECKEYRA